MTSSLMCAVGLIIGQTSANDLEKAALDYRRAIDTARITLRVTLQKTENNDEAQQANKKMTIFAKGQMLRVDVERDGSDGSSLSQSILTPQQFIENRPEANEARILDRKRMSNATSDGFHPRLLGIVPSSVVSLYGRGLQEILSRADRVDVSLAADNTLVEHCQRIDYKLKNPFGFANVRTWIAPRMGHAVLKIDVTTKLNAQTRLCQVTSDYSQFGTSKTWYPRTVQYLEALDDVVTYQEKTEVIEAEFGLALDDSIFAASSLQLTKGRRVLVNDALQFWNGERLVGTPPIVAPPIRSGRLVYFVLGIVLLALSVFFVRLYKSSRSQS